VGRADCFANDFFKWLYHKQTQVGGSPRGVFVFFGRIQQLSSESDGVLLDWFGEDLQSFWKKAATRI
tara:strand:- start:431 stop:631 length:201 start_codon:yes stop_codon:yes gene_type:complete